MRAAMCTINEESLKSFNKGRVWHSPDFGFPDVAILP